MPKVIAYLKDKERNFLKCAVSPVNTGDGGVLA